MAEQSDWHGVYREGWGSRLCPASFAHPAKNSYGLSVRIYEHALAEGWIEPGQVVLDPFAGIGGFALEAMRHGLNFVGVELEQRFVDMGQGCDCTGISKADWVRFQGRWDRARYKDGRHWCPECVMKASTIANERKFKPLPLPGTKWATIARAHRPQPTLFDAAPSTSYVRNSGQIPCTDEHRYHGNIETWEQDGMLGTAVIVQGDSRRLTGVLERANLCLSSPPYAGSIHSDGHGIDAEKLAGNKASPNSQALIMDGYGIADGQLAALPEGSHAEACERPAIAISSPPFGMAQSGGGIPAQMRGEGNYTLTTHLPGSAYQPSEQGTSPGQLAQMSPGDHAAALEAGAETGRAELCLSSPPYEGSINAGRNDDSARQRKAERHARGEFKCKRPDVFSSQSNIGTRGMFDSHYGDTKGQIGKETGSTFWAASRQILEEVYKVLAPGGHAIWVVKMFVRNKQLVDFPRQWETLCQSVGFKTVCKHRAWLNKNADIMQTTLDGDEVSMEKWYKSFFRRLCESKGSPRIDWELILCMEKPPVCVTINNNQ